MINLKNNNYTLNDIIQIATELEQLTTQRHIDIYRWRLNSIAYDLTNEYITCTEDEIFLDTVLTTRPLLPIVYRVHALENPNCKIETLEKVLKSLPKRCLISLLSNKAVPIIDFCSINFKFFKSKHLTSWDFYTYANNIRSLLSPTDIELVFNRFTEVYTDKDTVQRFKSSCGIRV